MSEETKAFFYPFEWFSLYGTTVLLFTVPNGKGLENEKGIAVYTWQ